MHKSGFVNIIGEPNVGKSTLMNALVGEKMSVITNKPQTTRHRIIGIFNDDNYQIVFSDTPGWIEDPGYKMHKIMNTYAVSTFEDADILMLLIDANNPGQFDSRLVERLKKVKAPKFLIINKIDLASDEVVSELEEAWKKEVSFEYCAKISALQKAGIEPLFDNIKAILPEGPAYYPKDQLTDRPERFFVSEIIRGHIFELYHQEIPYSCEVEIEEFIETDLRGEDFARIRANIIATRKTQKSILIGKNGAQIKALGIASRKEIEIFLGKRVHLELYVKVNEKWRDNDLQLKRFGYRS